jgi:propionyl-CoA synthetase
VCLNAGAERTEEEIEKECVSLVRQEIGPVAAFKKCVVVNALPKTRSGKILRGTMVSIADGSPWKMPATIDDSTVLDAIAERIGGLGEPMS